MNLDSQTTELLTGLLKGTDGAEQVQEEALLEALLVVGGLTATQPVKKLMYCSACQLTIHEHCPYCLLPVCEEIYLPILEAHLHSEEVDRMVEAMQRTVNEAKGRAL